MTASCPKCGGKWQSEGPRPTIFGGHSIGHEENTHYVLIPCGDRLEVICHYCETTITYLLSLEEEKQFAMEREAKLYKMINILGEELRKEKEKN